MAKVGVEKKVVSVEFQALSQHLSYSKMIFISSSND